MEGGREGGRGRREGEGRREGGGGERDKSCTTIDDLFTLFDFSSISVVEDEYRIGHVELKEMGEMAGYVGLKRWVT